MVPETYGAGYDHMLGGGIIGAWWVIGEVNGGGVCTGAEGGMLGSGGAARRGGGGGAT